MKPDNEQPSPAEPADDGHPPAGRPPRPAARYGRHQCGAVRQGEGASLREGLGAWDEVYQSHELEEDKLLVTLLEIQPRIYEQTKGPGAGVLDYIPILYCL